MALFGGIEIPGCPDLNNVRKLDVMIQPSIRRMMRLGFAIDRDYLWDLGSQFGDTLVDLRREITSHIPPEHLDKFVNDSGLIEDEEGDATINPASAEQIGRLLFDCLDVGRGKRDKLKTTKGGDRLTTGKKQLELVKDDHPVVRVLLKYRELSKLKTTYIDGITKLAKFHPRGPSCPICELKHDTDQWRVHGEIGTTRAATWRFNHRNPNMGNIPVRTMNGQLVLAGFIAPEGRVIYSRDLSQIELRCLAHLSNCHSMIEVYLADGDIHDNTSRKVFNLKPDEKPDKIKHRMASKRTNFSIQNGGTEKGLFLQLVMDYGTNNIPIPDWLTEGWCKDFIVAWLNAYPEVQQWFELQWYRARRYGLSWNPLGFCRLIPEVKSVHQWIREAGLRQAQNLPVTSLAAGQMKLCMARSDAVLAGMYEEQSCWPLMTIHDALMFEVDEDRVEEVEAGTEWAFDGCMDDTETSERMFRTPIKSDGESMVRWMKG